MSNTPQSCNYVDVKIYYFSVNIVFYPKNSLVQYVKRMAFLIRYYSNT